MKLTSYLRLKKPEGTDPVNVDDLNDNMDALDTAIQGLQTADGDISNAHVYTTAASTRANVSSGDTMATAFGKLMKLYSDLKGGAFATVANNDTVTAEGYVADARIVKTHGTEIDNLATRTTALETSFPAGCNTLVSKCTACGSTPASNSPAHIATAIQNIYTNRYNAGVSSVTLSRSGRTVNASNGQSISVPYTGTNGSVSCSTSGGTGNQTFNITDGWATEVVVDRSGAYNAGSNAVTLSTNGRTVTASNGKTASVAYAGTNGTVTCNTTAGTGNQTFNITDGWATEVIVNRTGAYNAGWSAGRNDLNISATLLPVLQSDSIGHYDGLKRTVTYTATSNVTVLGLAVGDGEGNTNPSASQLVDNNKITSTGTKVLQYIIGTGSSYQIDGNDRSGGIYAVIGIYTLTSGQSITVSAKNYHSYGFTSAGIYKIK